jgi:hypothetical protein
MTNINQKIEASLKLLNHRTGQYRVRTNSNGAKHHKDPKNDDNEQAMSKSIVCKDINEIVQQLQNTLDFTTSIQQIFNPNFEPLSIENVTISTPDNWITYVVATYHFNEEQKMDFAMIYH